MIGSGIMAALGLREANDVDIAVTPALYAALRASGEWEEEERYGTIFLKKGAVGIIPRLDWEGYATTAEAASFHESPRVPPFQARARTAERYA